jgi:predicted nucleic acid-binding protein
VKILLDTNVILDILLDREPFSNEASFLLSKVEQSEIIGFLCATTITTIHYLAAKSLGAQTACKHIRALLSLFMIAPVNHIVLENAIASGFNDFEDSVLHEAACQTGAQYIITRNPLDFKKSKLPVFEPREFIRYLESLKP